MSIIFVSQNRKEQILLLIDSSRTPFSMLWTRGVGFVIPTEPGKDSSSTFDRWRTYWFAGHAILQKWLLVLLRNRCTFSLGWPDICNFDRRLKEDRGVGPAIGTFRTLEFDVCNSSTPSKYSSTDWYTWLPWLYWTSALFFYKKKPKQLVSMSVQIWPFS
jgi:hypothetical protein